MGQATTIKNKFNSRNLVIMALGNIIGSGLFLGSGEIISIAGPAAILGYAIGGIMMFIEVMLIAEMSIVNPAPGAFRVHVTEVFGKGLGFINGWMFWCSGVLGMAGEVIAAAIFSQLWFPNIPIWIFSIVYSVVMTIINFCDIRGLSKIEAILSSIKIITLIGFIIFGLVIITRILPINIKQNVSSFSSARSFFPHGIKALLASMLLIMFSYTGTGIIGLAAADTENPAKALPPAIYTISISLTIIQVLAIAFIVLLTPWNMLSTEQSPFVGIMNELKIPFAASILNFIVLTAALSGLNSSMYSASRMLSSLSQDKQAPPAFQKTSKKGVPIYAVLVSSLVLILTCILSYLFPGKIFTILIGSSGFLAMFNWLAISAAHYFYRKKTLKECPEKLKYKALGYPFTTILLIFLTIGVLATAPLHPDQTISLIAGGSIIISIAIVYFVLKSLKRV